MMTTSAETPITIVSVGNDYYQIMPAPQYDRLPAGRHLTPHLGIGPTLINWENHPANGAAQRNLLARLEDVGRSVYSLFPGENLKDILQLEENQGEAPQSMPATEEAKMALPGSAGNVGRVLIRAIERWLRKAALHDNNAAQVGRPPQIKRRILIYTDSGGSRIPIEAMWSGETSRAGRIGFIAANPGIGVSIVRHLGLEPTTPVVVKKRQPLCMLIVFSNPAPGYSLGTIAATADGLVFTGSLKGEAAALDSELRDLVQLKRLEIHFLIGDESESTVYEGQVRVARDKLSWRVEGVHHHRELQDLLLQALTAKSWHAWHYFGHGAGDIDPELVLRPGGNLSCESIGVAVTRLPSIIILNACHSASPQNHNTPVLTGFATLCLMRGTVNLVCMQETVTPETATLTTRSLYSELSSSLFTSQMDFENALYEVRQQGHKAKDPRLDFFCPVLYARPVKGPIFDYRDDRLETWGLIQKHKLSWNPVKLSELVYLSSKLNRARIKG